jgi:hypothetical protein
MGVRVPNTSLNSRGKLAAIAGVAPPLRRSLAHITNQQLPPAMRELLRAIAQTEFPWLPSATMEMTTRSCDAERGSRQVKSLAFFLGIGVVVLVASTLVRQNSRGPSWVR